MAIDPTGIAAFLGGLQQQSNANAQLGFQNDMALAKQALAEAQGQSVIDVNRENIAASQQQRQMTTEAVAQHQIKEQANTMAAQIGEIKKAIIGGAVDPSRPEVKQNLDALWSQYRQILKQLVPGYEPPEDMFVPKRVLSGAEITAIQPYLEKIDTEDSQQAEALANAFGIETDTISQLGRQAQGLTAPEAANLEVATRGLDIQERGLDVQTTEAVGSIMTNFSKLPGFTALDADQQHGMVQAILSPMMGDVAAADIAGRIPKIDRVVSPDVAKQIAAQLYTAKLGLIGTREAHATQKAIAKLRANTQLALGKQTSETQLQIAGLRAKDNAAAVAQQGVPNPQQARKNIQQATLLLGNDAKLKAMKSDPAALNNVYNLMGWNYAALAQNKFAQYQLDVSRFAEAFGFLVALDPKPSQTNKSKKAWETVRKNMTDGNVPEDIIQWFYNERYAPVFGQKTLFPATKTPKGTY